MGTDMRIYYLQNENKEIIQDSDMCFDENCLSMDRQDYHLVNGYNGALFFAEYTQTDEYKAKAEAHKAKVEIFELRRKRQEECFSYINRGEIWYDRLTEEQKEELKQWYDAWLDVTETKVVPNKPDWLY